MKTLSEILLEIQEILDTSNLVEIRLQQFKASGYQIEFNWVKNGKIGEIFYMKKKQVYRIQISASERCGNYDKAYCIVIPVSTVSQNSTEMIKIRNIPTTRIIMNKLDKTGVKNKNNSIKI
jgi:hypothetical protein